MVSVIMLTYNRSSIVGQMIQGILAQTYCDFEFIIVDNGSNDNTANVLKQFVNADNRIKVITIPVSSIGRARNIGLECSTGQYIAYIDDDRVERDYLEFLVNLIRENDADISMCGATEGDGVTKKPQCLFDEKYVLSGTEAVRMLIGRKYIRNGTATKLYKREILDKHPFVENYRNEDIHTQYKYLLEARRVAIHGIEKYYIIRHEGNVSRFTSDSSKWDERTIRDYLEAYHNRAEYIREHAPDIYNLARYSEWSLMISMIEKINSYELKECEEIKSIMCKKLYDHREEFLNMEEIKAFERDWMSKYVL